jgi:hypothetical protein
MQQTAGALMLEALYFGKHHTHTVQGLSVFRMDKKSFMCKEDCTGLEMHGYIH